ncbi:MAG: hypothetical protein ABSA75_05910 [Candidatus Bathyarchaeia archaeon]|jgi:hypothetical protein
MKPLKEDVFVRVKGLTVMGRHDSFLSVGLLVQAKQFALRRGVWFRTLSRVERGILDLTVQCVDCIKSGKLAKLLTAIVDKLQSAMENIVDRLVRNFGLPLARKISNIAISWGNRLASMWADDRSFARFLVVNFSKA